MPRCQQCRENLPPDLCEETVGAHICIFCKKGVNYIYYNGSELTKEYAIRDYANFLYELSKNPNIERIIKSTHETDIITNK